MNRIRKQFFWILFMQESVFAAPVSAVWKFLSVPMAFPALLPGSPDRRHRKQYDEIQSGTRAYLLPSGTGLPDTVNPNQIPGNKPGIPNDSAAPC